MSIGKAVRSGFVHTMAAMAAALRWGGKIPEGEADKGQDPAPAYEPTSRKFGDYYRGHTFKAHGPSRSESAAHLGGLARRAEPGSPGRDADRAKVIAARPKRTGQVSAGMLAQREARRAKKSSRGTVEF